MKTIDRKNLNWSKIEELPTTNDMLDNLYGKEGSAKRESLKKKRIHIIREKSLNKQEKKQK